jgi:hypothetical protein
MWSEPHHPVVLPYSFRSSCCIRQSVLVSAHPKDVKFVSSYAASYIVVLEFFFLRESLQSFGSLVSEYWFISCEYLHQTHSHI